MKKKQSNNLIIREALKESGLCQWQLADLMQMREDTLSKMLRYELPESEQIAIAKLIRKEREE